MKRISVNFILNVLVVLAMLFANHPVPSALAADGPLCHVNAVATGNNDGSGWLHAYTDLQLALADPNCSEIWVAAGTYYPDSTDPLASFHLKDGVAIYGGFAGSEPYPTDLDLRDLVTNETILSGDIGTPGDSTDNSHHVVNGSGVIDTAVLDGFTITGGYNLTAPVAVEGAGIYIYQGTPTLRNLVVTNNFASGNGGGLYIGASPNNPILTNVRFENNQSSLNGGGMASVSGSLLSMADVTFTQNTASGDGGGLYNEESTVKINTGSFNENISDGNTPLSGGGGIYSTSGYLIMTDISFINNNARRNGGGLLSYEGGFEINVGTFAGNTTTLGNGGGLYADSRVAADISLANVDFTNNSAGSEYFPGSGGGMLLTDSDGSPFTDATVTIQNSNFIGNLASYNGGGMISQISNPTIRNTTFTENVASSFGGGMYVDHSDATLTKVTFNTNTAQSGGGIYNFFNNPELTDVTFEFNTAQQGGGMFNDNSYATLTDIMFEGNVATGNGFSAGGGVYNNSSDPILNRVIFIGNQGSYSGGGMYNLDSNPALTNVVFSGNFGGEGAGAMGNRSNSAPVLTNVTFSGNHADGMGYGGAISNELTSSPTILNSIFWGNTSTDSNFALIHNDASSPTFSYSLVQNSGESGPLWDTAFGLDGGNNIDADPLFVRNPNLGDYGDLHLQNGSPAIDAGDNSANLESSDLDGNPRIDNGLIDMGAYEYQATVVPPPDTSGNVTWPNALRVTMTEDSVQYGEEVQSLDALGETRWYKFSVQPGSRVIVKLSDLPRNYDLVLYKDIQQTYDSLIDPEDEGDLTKLTAEFAPYAYSPDSYADDAYSPYAYSPYAYSPYAYSPYAYSPYAYSPYAYSPYAYSPYAYSPYAYSPYAYSPYAYSPYAYSPYAYSPYAYSPDKATTSAEIRSVIGISAFEGTTGELIAVNTWDNTGDFYIRVAGRNGAFEPGSDFHLEVIQETGVCGSNIVANAPGTNISPVTGIETLILTDLGRMGPSDTTTELSSTLAQFAPSVNGVVVDINSDAEMSALNYQADTNEQCVFAKNQVAVAVKDIIDAYWEANLTSLKYIVIVGNDHVIPFYRYPDRAQLASEKGYNPPLMPNNTSYASLTFGYVLSQDFYGADINLPISNTKLPIPALAVGRLVETPNDIITVLNAFTDANGEVAPASALVTGYDFLEDAALAVQEKLQAGIGAEADTLIAPQDISPLDPDAWTGDDLRAALLTDPHDITFLAGHFSASRALAADFQTHMLASDVVDAVNETGVDFTNSIIFSAGCHAGYNIVTEHGIPGITTEPDWAQAFASTGATLIAGTGYQYGDTDFIEYNERLYLYFSEELLAGAQGEAIPIGSALMRAKQRYLATTPELRGIHEKALLEITLFGLPMLGVNMPFGRGSIATPTSIVGSTTGVLSDPGEFLGLEYADVTITSVLTEKQKILESVVPDGETPLPDKTFTYFEGGDGVVTRPGEPVLPLELRNVSVPNMVLRGIGFQGGSYADYSVAPLTGAPTTEVRGVHPSFSTDVFFPIRMWNANYFDVLANPDTGITRLALTPGQFLSDGQDSYDGTLRVFDDMNFRLYYSANTEAYNGNIPSLASPPTISKVLATENSQTGNVDFQVYVVGDLAAGVQEVWVTYSGVESSPFYGEWQSLVLSQNADDSRVWEGSLGLNGASAGDVRYIVQAANGVGLVALNTNLGSYFTPDVDPADLPVSGAPTTLAITSAPSSVAHGSTITFEAQLTSNGAGIDGQVVKFALGSQVRKVTTSDNGFAKIELPILTPPGNYNIRVAFVGNMNYQGALASAPVTVTKEHTVLSIDPSFIIIEEDSSDGITLSLKDSQGRPMPAKTIFAIVRQDGNDVYALKDITNYLGEVELKLNELPVGEYSMDAYFSGTFTYLGQIYTLDNSIYNASSASGTILVDPAPVIESINYNLEPVKINSPVKVNAIFSDPAGIADAPFTCTINFGDGTNQPGTVDNFECSSSYSYTTPGVYKITVTVTDKDGSSSSTTASEFVVVYDPSEGFVTGGGWFNSPEGAYTLDDALIGKAYFGFVSKYKKGATVPTGETEFEFTMGDLSFFSDDYDWLVIAGSKAMFKGTGTINGEGAYKFMISAIDGKETGTSDTFHIKIWEEIDGVEHIVYDNQIGLADDADPVMPLDGGSITVHSGKDK